VGRIAFSMAKFSHSMGYPAHARTDTRLYP
jgi:hypothetical protein